MSRTLTCLAAAAALVACKPGSRAAPGSDSASVALPPTAAARPVPAAMPPAPGGPAAAPMAAPAPLAGGPAAQAPGGGAGLGPITREHAGGTTILRAVGASPGAAASIVFEFDQRVPSYSVRYVDRPPQECGSGEDVTLPGSARLVVAFRNAAAHDDAGRATVADRDRRLAPGNLLALRLFCDFEGDVSWAAALERPAPFTATELASPPRLVVRLEAPGGVR